MRLSRFLLATTLAIAALPATAGACFDATKSAAIIALDAQLPAKTEELVKGAISEAIPPDSLYILARQMMLSERIHRHLLESGDCAAASDAIGRDLPIMKRVYAAFADGDSSLRIAALKAEQSQAILGEIQKFVAQIETGVAALDDAN